MTTLLPTHASALVRQAQAARDRGAFQRQKIIKQAGTFPVTATSNSYEYTATISFVNYFVERPHFTSGLELEANQSLGVGQYPHHTCFVLAWITQGSSATTAYTGAQIAVKLNGAGIGGTEWTVHYAFEGQAVSFSGAAQANQDTNTTI